MPPAVGDDTFRNRLENLMERYAGVAYTLYFVALAWLGRHAGVPPARRTGD